MFEFASWQDSWSLLVIVLVGGLIMAKLTEKPKIPDVVGYLVLGIALGPSAINLIHVPSQIPINQMLINLGATLILFEGGMGLSLETLKKTAVTVVLLATVGVLVTAAVVGTAAHCLLALPWVTAFLLAGVIASTDPATLIPVFTRINVKQRLQQTIEAESALNDATSAVLVFTMMRLSSSSGQAIPLYQPILEFGKEAGLGLIIGVLFGFIALALVSHRVWGGFHEYGSLVMLTTAMGAFLIATDLGGSGFMAAFAAGLMSGNGHSLRMPLPLHTRDNILHFNHAITILFRMLIFVLLGSQVDFKNILHYLWPALLLVAILMLIARPLTVASGALPDRRVKWKRNELLFMCWTRETGVIPAALASMVSAQNVPHKDIINAVTFVAIMVTILVQASSTGVLAEKLHLLVPVREEEV